MQKETKTQRERCNYASRYQALVRPVCGCKACEAKWEAKQKVKAVFKK